MNSWGREEARLSGCPRRQRKKRRRQSQCARSDGTRSVVHAERSDSAPIHASGLTRLACVLAVIIAVWLFALPSLSRRADSKAYLKELERRGIDPSAMFYTELPMMDPLLDRIEH